MSEYQQKIEKQIDILNIQHERIKEYCREDGHTNSDSKLMRDAKEAYSSALVNIFRLKNAWNI